MSINWQQIIFSFLGGLGLFLYSIRMMGDGLQQAAGDRLRYFIDKYTSNPFFGVLVGIGLTALILIKFGCDSYYGWTGKRWTIDFEASDWYCHGSQYRNDSDLLYYWF